MQQKLYDYLAIEKEYALENTSFRHVLKLAVLNHPTWQRWRYIKALRKAQFGHGMLKYFYEYRRNTLGIRLGFEINGAERIGCGLTLAHLGPIVINKKATLGENVTLHGDNCIGNSGDHGECPTIGNNVDIGVGAKIIGNIRVGNDCIIGAGAVVVSDIPDESVVAGVPAKVIKKVDQGLIGKRKA